VSKKLEQNSRELVEIDMLTKNAQSKLWEITTHTLTQQALLFPAFFCCRMTDEFVSG
jgi:hypothetical protein